MQYTLRDVPEAVDKALRQKARREGRSLNRVAVEALARGAGVAEAPVKYRDLSDLAGTWGKDPGRDAALAEQDRVDDELWK